MLEPLKQLIDDQRKTLKLFALGALLFFIGIGLIQATDKLMEPSLQQESYMLLAIIICGGGFLLSLFSQCLLIIHRFNKMGKRD